MRIARIAAQLLSLRGKVALISGGVSGIGRGIALRLAELGADVALLDIQDQKAGETLTPIAKIGTRAKFFHCDVRSDSDCRRAVEGAFNEFKRIDILCNNAGLAIRKNVVDLSEEEWDLSLDVMLKGVYLLSHHVIPYMIANGGGSIINIGSGWSLKGGPRAASYCAAKGGILNLTRAMAIDHGKHNIRVNCVCPGDVDTPLLRSECEQLGADQQTFYQIASDRPIPRLGKPEDVANAVLFFASNLSQWVTGTHLVVDGGGLA